MCQTTSIGLVLLLAVSVSCRNVPASSALKSSPSASVEPSSAYAYLKGRLDLTLEFDEPAAPLTGCFVQMPGSKSFELLPNEALVLNSEGRLAALYKLADGRCGVRVQPVENADDGVWKLKAVFSTSPPTDVEASATVTVKAYSDSVMPDLPSVSEGESFSLRLITLSPTAWSTCTVELPSGERVQVAPPDTAAESGSRIRFEGDGSSDDPKALCAVHVGSAGASDAGRWVLEATEQATGVVKRGMARVTVYMASMAVLPAKVAAEEGESTLFSLVFNDAKLAAGRQWTGCQAKRPDGKLVQLRGSGPDQDESGLVVDATVRVAEGPCAVQIGPLEKRHTGTWTLSAMEKGTSPTTRRAVAALVVKGPYVPVAANVSMTTGLLHVSFVCGPTDALSCTLSDPSGSETDFRGPCRHTLDRVREKHRGVWNCSALVKGYSGPVKDTVDVQINDPVHTEMAVTRTPAGVVLTCRLAGSSACGVKPTTCRFDPPTGPPLLVREAVLTQGRYSYAGRGLAACDCSMAIQAPLVPEDLGVWRCIIEFDNLRPRGGLAEVTAESSRGQRNTVGEAGTKLRAGTVAIHPVLEPSSGIVEPDATLKVGCRATRSLAYCWLRTPRGELLAVDENWRLEDNRGRYTGLGLELGECGIQVVASANHTGTWQCGVGLTGSGQAAMQDLELTLAVTVSESVLVAQQPSVTAFAGSGNSEAAVLVCRTAMDEGLRYCRFQRPDGSSILLADADSDRQGDEVGRLQYFGRAYGGLARGLCGVTISPVAEEDFGEWTCAVRLAGDVAGKEQNAVVQLLRAEQDIAEAALVGAGVGLVLVAAITAAVIWSRHYRKSRLRHRGASPQSWLSDGDSEDLVMDVRNSPSPTSSTGGRSNRRRTATMLASGMATMRLRARTQRPNRTTRTRASSSTQQMPRAASDGAESGAVGTESPGGGL